MKGFGTKLHYIFHIYVYFNIYQNTSLNFFRLFSNSHLNHPTFRKPPPIEPKPDAADADEEEIDILSEETSGMGLSRLYENDDEVLVKNPALDCVIDIRSHPGFPGMGFLLTLTWSY